jgi:hypothetical protein
MDKDFEVWGLLQRYDKQGKELPEEIVNLNTEEHKWRLDFIMHQKDPSVFIDPVPEDYTFLSQTLVRVYEFEPETPDQSLDSVPGEQSSSQVELGHVARATKLKKDLEWMDKLLEGPWFDFPDEF